MANYVPVDSCKNKSIAISSNLGRLDAGHLVPVIASELRKLVCNYPVFFVKDPRTGQFVLTAVLGFDEGENLFVSEGEWTTQYLPLDLQRQPFIVEKSSIASTNEVLIDLDNPLVGSDGDPIFTSENAPSESFLHKVHVLERFLNGLANTKDFINIILGKDLITQATIQIPGANPIKYDGLYTIDEKKLMGLSDADILKFHKNGVLMACNLIIASTQNIEFLISRKSKFK